MDEKKIGEIVRKVHEKAKKSCVSEAKNALANHVEDAMFNNYKKKLSYRTVERAFERHILKDRSVSERSPESINLFCMYLGYENYAAYIIEEGKGKNRVFVYISIGLILMLGIIFYLNLPSINKTMSLPTTCMVWTKTHYEKILCDKKLGREVEQYDSVKLVNFTKAEVKLSTTFFDEDTGRPLYWYYKTSEGEIEFYTAPGLHPITKKTLKEVTPYIIEKYVPKHVFNVNSYLVE